MMKKLFYTILLVVVSICFSGSLHGMKRANNILSDENQVQVASAQEVVLRLPELITKIAGYCQSKEKNTLMRLNNQLCKCLKNRTAILRENPSTVGFLDKVEAMIEYAGLGNIEMMKVLFDHGINADCTNILGIYPLHAAIKNKKSEAMQLLIENGADVDKFKPAIHPLHEAVYERDIELVCFLLNSNVDPNCSGNNGVTALHIGAFKGYTEIVKLLLDAQANVNSADEKGWTPLCDASYYGHIETVKLLITEKADVHHVTGNGETALLVASESGHTEIIKLLLDAGADIEYIGPTSVTPLFTAVEFGNKDTVEFLLKRGADVNFADINGENVLMCAIQCGHTDIVQLLLADERIKINQVDNNGWNALLVALECKKPAIAKLLIDHGANINCVTQDDKKTSPLLVALECGLTDIATLLIDKGADINHADSKGHTPLLLASRHYKSIKKLLRAKGASKHNALCSLLTHQQNNTQ